MRNTNIYLCRPTNSTSRAQAQLPMCNKPDFGAEGVDVELSANAWSSVICGHLNLIDNIQPLIQFILWSLTLRTNVEKQNTPG